MGFWEDFAKGFVPAYQAGLERRWKSEEAEKQRMEQRRSNLLNLVGKVAARRAERSSETGEYMNSVPALMDRLRDEEGNLVAGSEALVSDPRVAHQVLTKINKIEQQAAKDDNIYTPRLYGEVIVDNFTAYNQGGQRVAVPNVSVDELLTGVQSGDWSDKEAYEKEMLRLTGMTGGTPSTPEPVVQVKPELMRKPDPKNLEGTRQAYQRVVTRMLDEDIAAASQRGDETVWDELTQMREDINENNEKAISWNQLNELYGGRAYEETVRLAAQDDYLMNPSEDSWFNQPRRQNEKINALMNVTQSSTYSEEERREAARLLKQKYGIDVR